jgi:hypothetical protein
MNTLILPAPPSAEELRQVMALELLAAVGVGRSPWAGRFLRPLVGPALGRMAAIAAAFENRVRAQGLREAARALLPRFISGLEVRNLEALPAEGPLVVASNHPGAYDAFLIAATLPRDDLKVVSSSISILRALPATASHFVFLTHDSAERMAATRAIIRHLRDGGALLIFPTGMVDPDPDVLPGAGRALDRWSASLDVFLRHVPQAAIAPTIVSSVLSPGWFRFPLTWLRRERHQRQITAEILQVMQQLLLPRTLMMKPRLSYSAPLSARDLASPGAERVRYLPGLIRQARSVLEEHVRAGRSQLLLAAGEPQPHAG